MDLTTNLNLRKPEDSDPILIADLNYNADILDEKLGVINKQSGKTGTLVIPKTWINNTDSTTATDYPLMVSVNIPNLVKADFIDITINAEDMKIANKAGICPTVKENVGSVTLIAKKAPTAVINCRYKVVV